MGNVTVKNPLMIASGNSLKLINKYVDIHSNGTITYEAQDENADGYKSLTVNAYVSPSPYSGFSSYEAQYIGTYENRYQILTGFSKSNSNFYKNSTLNYLEIADGCRKIDACANFFDCTYLNTLILPKTIEQIHTGLGANKYLTKVYYKGTLEEWCKIQFSRQFFPSGAQLYVSNDNGATYILVEEITKADFPNWSQNNPIEISGYAFSGCGSLRRVSNQGAMSAPGGFHVGSYAFWRCENLTSVTLFSNDSNSSYIGEGAFEACIKLQNLQVTNSRIGTYAFTGNRVLNNVYLYNVPSIYTSAFMGCSSLRILDLSSCPLTSIPNGMCASCSNLFKVILPDSLVSIGENAFSSVPLLATILIPEHVTSIGLNAFYGTYLYEVCNLSSMTFTIGDTGNGYIAYYASYILDNNKSKISYDSTCAYNNETGEVVSLFIPKGFNDYSCRIPEKEGITGPCPYLDHKISPDFIYQIIIGDDVAGNFSFTTDNKQLKEIINYSSDVQLNVPSSITVYNDIENSQLRIVDNNYIALNNNVLGYLPDHVIDPVIITDQSVEAFLFDWYMLYVPMEVDLTQTNITRASFNESTKIIRVPATIEDMNANNSHSYRTGRHEIIDYRGTIEQWIRLARYATVALEFDRSTIIQNGVALDSGLYINGSLLTNVVIPSDVTFIAEDRFANCYSLQSVYFEDQSTCSIIRGGAFFNCTNLSSINLPNSLTEIQSEALEYTNLGTLTIPANVSTINSLGSTNLDNIYSNSLSFLIPLNSDCLVDSNNYLRAATNNCIIPNTVVGLYKYDVFDGLKKIKNITYSGAGEVSAAYSTAGCISFRDCVSLETVDLSESTITGIISLGNCSSLKTLICPVTMTKLGLSGYNPWTNLYSLKSVYLLNDSSVVLFGEIYDFSFDHNVDFFVPEELLEDYRNQYSYLSKITFKPLP